MISDEWGNDDDGTLYLGGGTGRGGEGRGGEDGFSLRSYTTVQFERQLCMGGNLLRQNDSLGTGQQPAYRNFIHVFTGLWGHVLMNLMTLTGIVAMQFDEH